MYSAELAQRFNVLIVNADRAGLFANQHSEHVQACRLVLVNMEANTGG